MGAVILALATGLGASAAAAQVNAGQDALFIKSLAATCANCHGTAGQAVAGSANVSLAGLDIGTHFLEAEIFRLYREPNIET
jgi:cytochrome c553